MFQNTVLKSVNFEEVTGRGTPTISAILETEKIYSHQPQNPSSLVSRKVCMVDICLEDLWIYSLVGFNLKSSSEEYKFERNENLQCIALSICLH